MLGSEGERWTDLAGGLVSLTGDRFVVGLPCCMEVAVIDETVTCPDCGTAGPGSPARFCGRCGALLAPPAVPTASPRSSVVKDDREVEPRPQEQAPAPDGAGPGALDGRWQRWWPRGAVLAVLTVLVVGIVSFWVADDDSPLPPAPDDPEVRTYLDEVARIEQVRADGVHELRQTLFGTYGDRSTWLGAFADAAAAVEAEQLDTRARGVVPPGGYEEIHRRWIAAHETSGAHLTALQRALERDDLLAAGGAVVALEVGEATLAAGVPPHLCAQLAVASDPAAAGVLCRDRQTLPGGTYGRELYEALLAVRTEVFPRIAFFPPGFTDAETLAFLAVIQPDVERVLGETLTVVGSLDPPPELHGDHDALIGYLVAMTDIAADITAAAVAGDIEALDPLFARSAEPGNELQQRVSPAGGELMTPVLPP